MPQVYNGTCKGEQAALLNIKNALPKGNAFCHKWFFTG